MQNKSAAFVLLLTGCLSVSSVKAQEMVGLEDIGKGWKTKTISNVSDGSFGTMLERFDQTWPTWMVSCVTDAMKKGQSKVVLDEETALKVIVDVKNGYAEVSDAGTDGEYMSACYWSRPNGHKLLAVCLGDPTDPFIEFVCFYDYDPQLKALIPEPGILAGFKEWSTSEPYYCKLPKKGKDLIIDEEGDGRHLRHTFAWDGMKPVFSKTETIDDEDTGIPVSFKGAQPNVKDFLTAYLSQEELGESLSCMAQSWELYQKGMKLMPGDSFIVDVQNGYIGYESGIANPLQQQNDEYRMVQECCYWKCADRKRMLVAFTNDCFQGSLPVMTESTGLTLFMYDPDTRKMELVYALDLGIAYDLPEGVLGLSHELPRKGKTMIINYYLPSGKIPLRYTWNGTQFIKE